MIMKDKICVIGAFDFVNLPTGGQPVKTRELYYSLVEKYGKSSVDYIDTYGWKKNPFRLLVQLFIASIECRKFIMLPAHNGVKIFSLILLMIKKCKKIKVFYSVIGGWLPELTQADCFLKKRLMLFDGIWVETSSMKNELIDQGFKNISIVHNFKHIQKIEKNNLADNLTFPIKVCTFSRVMQEKGIEDAIEIIAKINNDYGSKKIHLDIYGQIDSSFSEKFEELLKKYKEDVKYCGVISPNQSVETIKSYFALLFPTHYYTEGIPGTIIDAYFAGVPVITAIWKNADDIFVEGKTGWGYEFDKLNQFEDLLKQMIESPSKFSSMKESTLEMAEKFQPNVVIEQISELMK